EANLKDTEGDTVLETKIDTHHDDVSYMVKDLETRITIRFRTGLDHATPIRKNRKPDQWNRIYDSYRSAGHDAAVMAEVNKIATLLPLYLTLIGFYRDKKILTSQEMTLIRIKYSPNLWMSNLWTVCRNKLMPRYDALFWDYGTQKIEGNAIRDDEPQAKSNRPFNNSTSHPDIVSD
ncbi:hypothetical protein HAX54_031068, partial [Datura stramonium]|nr:hypothetical protein [Datura stramonium]